MVNIIMDEREIGVLIGLGFLLAIGAIPFFGLNSSGWKIVGILLLLLGVAAFFDVIH